MRKIPPHRVSTLWSVVGIVALLMNAGCASTEKVEGFPDEFVGVGLELKIIDGFPRDPRQAEFFLESYDIDAVINLEMEPSEVERRVLSRRLCSGCGLDYNLIQHRPATADECDVCGGTLIARPDDNPEAIRDRLREYHASTQPIVELFERKELVVKVDGTKAPDQVQAAIRSELGVD